MPIVENPTPHIFHKFDRELEDIRSRVMAMGGLVEQQLSDALYALVNGDGALAEDVVANDYEINRMDVEIDATCTHVLARRQPTASDLRLVLAVIKTTNDLERIGDESKHIGRIGLRLAENPHAQCRVSQIEHMGNRVKRMLHQSLDALARGDVDQAIEVALEDKKVDRDHEAVMRQMLTYMMEDPRNIPEITELCWSARALERVGDRSRNICEYVIYLVKGKDVRHVNPEHLADEIVAS